MTSIALDYGSADASAAPATSIAQDDTMTDAQQENGGSRFYALPTDQAVEAGAQRGPSPLTEQDGRKLDDATLMGTEEPSETPDPPAVEGGSDVSLETLLIEGMPITQMSTSRLFAYLTHYGAQPLGLEWVDDQRCKVVFADERSARIGLEYLCPVPEIEPESYEPLPNMDLLLEYDPDSWPSQYITSLVAPRKAHRIPAKLYNHVERQAALTVQDKETAVSSLPDDVPEIYKEMEMEERQKAVGKEVQGLQKLRSALWLRHAVQDYDRKEARSAKRSQWYRQHGFEAGREIVPKLLQVGEVGADVELFPGYKPGEAQNASGPGSYLRDGKFGGPHTSEESRRRPGEMMADVVQANQQQRGDLFDRLSSRAVPAPDSRWTHDAHDRHENGRRGRGRDSRGPSTINELDEELDQIRSRQHAREASPGRQPAAHGGARTKVKGRGRMKAPGMSVWGHDDEDWNRAQPNSDRNNASRDDRWAKDDAQPSLSSRFGDSADLLSRFGGEQKTAAPPSDKPLADRFS